MAAWSPSTATLVQDLSFTLWTVEDLPTSWHPLLRDLVQMQPTTVAMFVAVLGITAATTVDNMVLIRKEADGKSGAQHDDLTDFTEQQRRRVKGYDAEGMEAEEEQDEDGEKQEHGADTLLQREDGNLEQTKEEELREQGAAGSLSREEMEHHAQNIFHEYDVDNSGFLEEDEVHRLTEAANSHWRIFDTEGGEDGGPDGKLSVAELLHSLHTRQDEDGGDEEIRHEKSLSADDVEEGTAVNDQDEAQLEDIGEDAANQDEESLSEDEDQQGAVDDQNESRQEEVGKDVSNQHEESSSEGEDQRDTVDEQKDAQREGAGEDVANQDEESSSEDEEQKSGIDDQEEAQQGEDGEDVANQDEGSLSEDADQQGAVDDQDAPQQEEVGEDVANQGAKSSPEHEAQRGSLVGDAAQQGEDAKQASGPYAGPEE